MSVVLVTGAGRGLGRATAEAFLGVGADLVLHYHVAEAGAREVATQAEAAGRCAVVVQGDLTRGEEARRVVAVASDRFGRLDVLVNNAGGIHRSAFTALSEVDWDAMVDVNLKSAFLVTQAAEALLRQGGQGSVVNVASVGGLRPRADMPHYCAAKAGLIMLTQCLALALAPAVRVNAFAPAFLAVPPGAPPDYAERMMQRSPLKRIGSYAEAGQAILRLAAAPYMTGQVAVFDGGLSLV